MKKITPAEINKRNREFWQKENRLLKERLTDDVLRRAAIGILDNEDRRHVPGYYRVSLEEALADAEGLRHFFRKQQAIRGGRTSKEDTLHKLIFSIVKQEPRISWKNLLSKLGEPEFSDLIEKISDTHITFKNHDGRTKPATISGLKDRLRRARKKLNSR